MGAIVRAVVCSLLLGSAMLCSVRAGADEIDRCLASHSQAQRSRRGGKLRESRTGLLVCARSLCPRVVRTECGRFLTEVDALLPAVVISARTPAGEDLSEVRVIVAGELALSRLDGRPLPLDPGQHQVRVEAPGRAPQEQSFLIVEGETARPLTFTLTADADRSAPPLPGARSSPEAGASPSLGGQHRPVPTSVYVLGGVGAVALGSFAVFGLTGRSDYLALKGTCAPGCPASGAAPVRNKLLVADVSLGVAVVAIGAGAALFFMRPTVAPASATNADGGIHLEVHARAGGMAASVAGEF